MKHKSHFESEEEHSHKSELPSARELNHLHRESIASEDSFSATRMAAARHLKIHGPQTLIIEESVVLIGPKVTPYNSRHEVEQNMQRESPLR